MKKSPRRGTHKFLVSGPVPGFKDEINLWTSAVSEEQALLQIQKRLEKKFEVPIYLGNCTVKKYGQRSACSRTAF